MNMHTLGAGFVDHGCDRRTGLIEPESDYIRRPYVQVASYELKAIQ